MKWRQSKQTFRQNLYYSQSSVALHIFFNNFILIFALCEYKNDEYTYCISHSSLVVQSYEYQGMKQPTIEQPT